MLFCNHRVIVHLFLEVLSILYSAETKSPIYIGGLFPMQDGGWDGSAILPASEQAIEDVNKDATILPQYNIQMIWNNSKCEVGAGVASLFYQLHSGMQLYGILGAGCSTVTKVIAETAAHWNLVQVSHSSSSPDLNDRTLYPMLFTIPPSDGVTNPSKVILMQTFKWKRAAILQNIEGSFTQIVSDLQSKFIKESIDVVAAETFHDNPTVALQNIKRKDGRVIFLSCFPDKAWEVFCTAFKMEMTGPAYTWILPGWYDNDWLDKQKSSCTDLQMTEATRFHLVVDVISMSDADESTDFSRTPRQFLDEYNTRTANQSYGGMSYSAYGYDSVWVLAYALHTTEVELRKRGKTLLDFDYTRNDISDITYQMLNATDLKGISGHIKFDNNGMRIGETRVKQFQDRKYETVAFFKNGSIVLARDRDFRWKTKSKMPPLDGPVIIRVERQVDSILFACVSVIAVLGIIFSTFLLFINVKFRHRRILKMSSPKINYLICSNGIVLYATCVLFGVKIERSDENKNNHITVLCIIPLWLLSLSFTACLGAVIAKSWRLRKIILGATKYKQKIKDSHLFLIVFVLLIIDLIFLSSWLITEPLTAHISFLDIEEVEDDTYQHPYVFRCRSDTNHWIIGICSYKGLLLIYGAIVAWENRKVKINLLNDARPLAFTVYTIAILCGIWVPVSFVMETRINFVYGLSSAFIIIGTTVMLGCCCVQKVQIVLSNSVATENILIANMANTDNNDRLDMTMALKQQVSQMDIKIKRLELELKGKQLHHNGDSSA